MVTVLCKILIGTFSAIKVLYFKRIKVKHCVKVTAKPVFYNATYLQEKQDIQRRGGGGGDH